MPAILATASYLPPARLPLPELRRHWPSGGGRMRSVAVAGYDEDVVTLAVAAAERALSEAGLSGEQVDTVALATCSSPYAEHSAAAEVARALGVPRGARLLDMAGTTLGGVNALLAAADAVTAGRARLALVVAAERRRGAPGTPVEALGAGAVAVLVSEDGPATIGASRSWRHGVPTRWRADGERTVSYYDDARYEVTEQISPAVQAVLSGLDLDAPAFCALGPLDTRAASTLARSAGMDGELGMDEVEHIGDLGAGAPLFSLAACLDRVHGPADGFCVAVEPGAGAVGVSLRVESRVPVASCRPTPRIIDYVEYLQRFGELQAPAPPDPIVPYAATPGALRDDAHGSLSGTRCHACGSLNIPPRNVCIDCGSGESSPERAPRLGTVVTCNVQHVVAVHPEPAPVAVGVIRIDGMAGTRGGQVSAMFCDSPLELLRPGAPAELVYRRLGVDAGLVKYGWKARLVLAQAGDESAVNGDDSTNGNVTVGVGS